MTSGLRALVLVAVTSAACGETTTARLGLPPLETVAHVDLARYLGTWYEIASFPQRFQRGCTATTATYSLRADGDIDVVNRCRKGSPSGKEEVARGRARVVDRVSGAKLEVSFFRPFWDEYWVIDLAPGVRGGLEQVVLFASEHGLDQRVLEFPLRSEAACVAGQKAHRRHVVDFCEDMDADALLNTSENDSSRSPIVPKTDFQPRLKATDRCHPPRRSSLPLAPFPCASLIDACVLESGSCPSAPPEQKLPYKDTQGVPNGSPAIVRKRITAVGMPVAALRFGARLVQGVLVRARPIRDADVRGGGPRAGYSIFL